MGVKYNDYNFNVFDQQLSIWNEGTLPIGLSIEDLKTDHNSRPRNPIIANACFLAGYIDSWGRGTLKIINACKEYGLPEPLIREKDGGIEVSIQASNQVGNEDVKEELVKGLVKELTENQLKLLELIEADPTVTKQEMANHVGISTTAIDKNLKSLKEIGVLQRAGGTKKRYWQVKNHIK